MKYYIVPSNHHTPGNAFRSEESAKSDADFKTGFFRKAISVETALTTDEFDKQAKELRARLDAEFGEDDITRAAAALLERLGF